MDIKNEYRNNINILEDFFSCKKTNLNPKSKSQINSTWFILSFFLSIFWQTLEK